MIVERKYTIKVNDIGTKDNVLKKLEEALQNNKSCDIVNLCTDEEVFKGLKVVSINKEKTEVIFKNLRGYELPPHTISNISEIKVY